MDGSDTGFRVRGLGLAVALLLGGCEVASRAEDPASDPPGWTRAEIAGELSLALPPRLELVPGKSADSIVRTYRSDSLRLVIDYGRYSNSLTDIEGEDLERRSVEVDGRAALLVTYREPDGQSDLPYVAALHVPDVGKDGRVVRLTLIGWSASERIRAQAVKILRSVEFTTAVQ